MLRYCTNCNKNVDIQVKSTIELDHLVCPICGSSIDKNSKARSAHSSDQTEQLIGKAVGVYMYFIYFVFLVCAIVGVVAYCMGYNLLLYVVTGFTVCFYLLRYGNHELGIIWLPISAVAGFAIWKSMAGLCLGLMIGLIIRHVIRRLLWGLIAKLIHVGNQ